MFPESLYTFDLFAQHYCFFSIKNLFPADTIFCFTKFSLFAKNKSTEIDQTLGKTGKKLTLLVFLATCLQNKKKNSVLKTRTVSPERLLEYLYNGFLYGPPSPKEQFVMVFLGTRCCLGRIAFGARPALKNSWF